MSDLLDFHIGVHEETAVQFLNGEPGGPDIHFDKAKAKRVACKVVFDDLRCHHDSEREEKISQMT